MLLRLNRIPGATPGPIRTGGIYDVDGHLSSLSALYTERGEAQARPSLSSKAATSAPYSWERVRARLDHTVVGRPST